MSHIHFANITEVHEMPISEIIRPFQPEIIEEKVIAFMKNLMDPNTPVSPIDVLWITGSQGGNYFYSFGGYHRQEAHTRLHLDTIRVKVLKSNLEVLKCILGSSTPDLK